MAILAEGVYKLVRDQLVSAGIRAYSDYIPDETAYPFCMYEIVSMESDPDWAFTVDYELLTVRFNIYTDKVNPIEAITIAETIEDLFNRTKLTIDPTIGSLICNHKSNDTITFLNEDHYWLVTSDYEFRAQRDM